MVKKLVTPIDGNDIEITDKNLILENLHEFYQNLFQRKSLVSQEECDAFLNDIDVPKISDDHKHVCDNGLSIDELKDSLLDMHKKKTPGNDGLTSEFYLAFWDDIKNIFFSSVNYSFEVGHLSTSQRQAIIKLLEKRDKDKRYISNWRPISLLNVDTKIIAKCFAKRLVPVLPTLISSDQTAYVKGRFIGESTRLISDILDICDSENISGFLLTADLEKAFDSIDHTFLISCLEKYGFGPNFINWVKILLNQNESCVINGGTTTNYFQLSRGARQGDPIAAYFFILVLEIFFIMIRSNNNIKQLQLFGFNFLLSAYADDTTFFVADLNSIICINNTFNIFSQFSGLKLNQSKCELCGIGAKKGDETALCGFRNVNLKEDSIRVLGVHFSYNKNICLQRNFIEVIKKMENVLNLWKMRNLTLSGKITIFKTLAISKIVYISYLSHVPTDIINILEILHKNFIWDNKRAKIKHTTLISDYCDGGLKDVDIKSKIKALHLSWLKRLFDENSHPWKLIPTYIFKKLSKCSSTIFYPNLHLSPDLLTDLPLFYKNLVINWMHFSISDPKTTSSILSESVWNNALLKIDFRPIQPSFFRMTEHIFIRNLLDDNGNFLSWNSFKDKYNLDNNMFFKWMQLKNCIPNRWLNLVNTNLVLQQNLCNFDPHINNNARICSVQKLSSAEIYKILIKKIEKPPTSQVFYNNKYDFGNLWKKIYLLPRFSTVDTYSRIFQYKILNNILFLNDKLFHLNLVASPLCSLCNNAKENVEHLFYECSVSKALWSSLQLQLINFLPLNDLTPQSAVIGFLDEPPDTFNVVNHILIIYKIFIFKNRDKNLSIYHLLAKIKNVVKIEGFESFS